ncbi:hypothetical protein [Paenibacillus fonticola]|uniref:hypothetical protein n=1 Tax=Paenibacillus fonticola TaxID=379896 RepID=UPI0003744811|nr:hypothetical protein [Paenibacillus fonticola]
MKRKNLIITAVFVAGVLSGCGNTTNTAPNSSSTPITKERTNSVQENAENSAIDFTPGVFIDWDSVNEPLMNEQIKTVLKETLEALVNKDREKFKNQFIDAVTLEDSMYVFDTIATFDQIDSLEEDRSGRISVGVLGTALQDNNIIKYAKFFYFNKDDQGNWKLVAID